ncbi:MAG TPA: hypothetical protein VE823_02735 [Geodermatophilus sp.]|nr:hypothetical protein [Geodermatophilus sp.]
MSHPDPLTSGSRWEPAAQPAHQPAVAADEQRAVTAEIPGAPGAAPAGATARRVPRRRARRAGSAAVAAAALLFAGGLGGFAVGIATAGGTPTTSTTSTTQGGVPGPDTDGDGVPDGPPSFGGRGLPPGTGSGAAVLPGTTDDDAPSGTAAGEGDPA